MAHKNSSRPDGRSSVVAGDPNTFYQKKLAPQVLSKIAQKLPDPIWFGASSHMGVLMTHAPD
eukprot:1222096-Karenia_brevis.AAC.1